MTEVTPARAREDVDPPEGTGPRLVLYSLVLTLFLSALDQTVVATALPTVAGRLHGLDHLAWVVTAYTLTAGVSMPLYGKLGDMYGRKPLFVLATVLFVLGSALSGLAQSMGQLIAFRGVQGLGAGGLMVLAMAIVADVTTPRERGRYMGFFGAVFGVASLAGPFVGGFLTDHLSWRWAFYVNVPLGAIALLISVTRLKLPRRKSPHRVDYAGALLLAGAIACVTLGTTWGGREQPWSSPTILGLGAGFVGLLTLFLVVESRAAEPLVPLRLLRDPTFTVASVATVLVGTALLAGATYLPLFLQFTAGADATSSGLLLFPMMAGMIFSSTVGGRLISHFARYKWAPVLGSALAALGTFLLSTMDLHTGRLLSGSYMALLGLGIGLVSQPLMLAIQTNAPRADLGAATSTATFAQRIGGAVGLSVLGAVFNGRLAGELATEVPARLSSQVPDTGSLSPKLVNALPGPLREGVRTAFSDTLTEVFLWMTPLLIAGFLLSLTLRNVRLGDDEPDA
ncbi:MDR family MFS transporter [Streptomyces sp. NPDC049954]|uniref:MDR family MFS transporter n=1 Tax=Streptomyces sp. NPDC049954 TaxID=3155779 RepID=UPI00341327F5